MNDKSISAWQAGIILFILFFANKILLLPSLIFKEANVEGIFTILILFLLEFGLITLFVLLKHKYPTLSFQEVLKIHLGSFVQKMLYVFFAIFFVSKILLSYNVTYAFFNDLIYKQNNPILYLVCFLPIMTYFAYMPLRVLGRTSQIFLPMILCVIFFCVTASFFGLESHPLLFQSGISDVLMSVIHHTSAFGDSIFLLVFMDKIRLQKGDGKKLYFMAGIAFVFIFLIYISFYLAFTYTVSLHSYAIFEILGSIRSFGGIGRVDVVSLILVMIFTFFHLGIYLKAFVFLFVGVFPNLNSKYALVLFDVLFAVVINIIIKNLEKIVMFAENIFCYISIVPFVIVPVFVLILLLGRRKNE